jgi:hypothetical protein
MKHRILHCAYHTRIGIAARLTLVLPLAAILSTSMENAVAAPVGELPPKAGHYACLYAQFTPNVVMSGGTIVMMPAVWGEIVMDGKGGYRVTSGNGSGRYTYNLSTSRLSFTGSFAKMAVVDYRGGSYSFKMRGGGLEWVCSIARPKPTAASTPAVARDPNAPHRFSGSDRFSGKYVGLYQCRGNSIEYWMEMQAKADGNLSATMHFGDSGTPSGSYTLTGNWQDNAFDLKPGQWISRPQGYEMGGVSGQLDGYRFTGRFNAPNCSVMTGRKYE